MEKMKINLKVLTIIIALVSMIVISNNNVYAQTNSQLKDKVVKALSQYYNDLSNINISANNNGDIQISGSTPTLYDKYNIFDIVSKVHGVKTIQDLLDVKTALIPDDEIQANIIEELHLVNSILEPDRIKVHVENGMVFLSGDVSYYREKLMAETVASWQNGAKGIQNNITVLPPKEAKSDQNIKIILGEILNKDFPLDNGLTISVNNGVVNVSGNVVRLWDIKHIKDDFYKVLGVKEVIENLKVEPVNS